MKTAKKVLAIALGATLACGALTGCNLVTKDARKDYLQVIATVDISLSADFSEGGDFAEYASVVQPAEILKRDMIASYVSSGYSMQSNYGLSYSQIFEYICQSLVTRQIDVQYAMAYLLKNGDADGNTYSLAQYNSYVETHKDKGELAGLEYFLSENEVNSAYYATRRLINNTLDSQEKTIIKSTEEDENSVTPRTLPTGVNSDNPDYYDTNYQIYTGMNTAASCAPYETVEGSTPTTRKNAYNSFLSMLRLNYLLDNNENTSKVEQLNYFKLELKTNYESQLITKLQDALAVEAEKELDKAYMDKHFEDKYNEQKTSYSEDKTVFESALDGFSDTNPLLTAPEENYGYVINILLPFSKAQSDIVSGLGADFQDPKGNSFSQRGKVLEQIKATDQRGTWFTGEEDYSYIPETSKGFTNGDDARKYLFFDESLNTTETGKYEPLKKYYGKYTYNGSVYKDEETGKYTLTPKKIDIDEFIGEMENYLESAELTVTKGAVTNDYFNRTWKDFYKSDEKTVDYSKFVYYEGKVEFANGFKANDLFDEQSEVYKAFSVINELSFAYNTDTAGLNPYLGYSVVAGKTNFVSEFEFAAQKVCEEGAGSYIVVPSDYGWHVIYCTFSFKKNGDEIKPFSFNFGEAKTEGTFSYNYYEMVKANVVENYSSRRYEEIAKTYNAKGEKCVVVYEDRYADLSGMN